MVIGHWYCVSGLQLRFIFRRIAAGAAAGPIFEEYGVDMALAVAGCVLNGTKPRLSTETKPR